MHPRRHQLLVLALIICVFTAFAPRPQAAPIDANGNARPDSSDEKTTVLDHSNGKEAPPITPAASKAPPDTEFRIGLPGWIAGLSGDFGVAGVVIHPDVDFTQILSHLDMIATGSVYGRHDRWEFSADGLYLKLSTTADARGVLFDGARASLKQAFAEWFLGYRLINCESGFLSVAVGGRFNYMQGSFRPFGARLASRSVDAEGSWVDPVLAVSGKVHLWKPVSLWAKGDIGGFGVASDFAWQVQGGLEVQMTRSIYSAVGWRYMKYDYTSGGFTNKTDLNGPYIETGIKF